MKGNICIVSETGWAVSNDAELSYTKDVIDTPDGRRSYSVRLFEAINPFGSVRTGEAVKVAFQAEDGNNVSYTGEVDRVTESRIVIKVLEQINEYKQLIERVLSWHKA